MLPVLVPLDPPDPLDPLDPPVPLPEPPELDPPSVLTPTVAVEPPHAHSAAAQATIESVARMTRPPASQALRKRGTNRKVVIFVPKASRGEPHPDTSVMVYGQLHP